VTGEYEHSWAAATLHHMTQAEAEQAGSDPAYLGEVAALNPYEVIGPFCTDCFVFLAEDAHHSSE
jgi:hypothetical protein